MSSQDHPTDSDEPRFSVEDALGPDGWIAQRLPGYEYRPQQLAHARLVEQAIASRQHVVAEAGTGTGKSLAYLVPAVLSRKRTIVSTAVKALQEQLARKDIPFLQSAIPLPFSATVLKGRSNYLCLYEYDRARSDLFGPGSYSAPDVAEAWHQLGQWLQDTEDGDLETLPFSLPAEVREAVTVESDGCIGRSCRFFQQCYAERARRRAEQSDVIVVNHALLLRDQHIRELADVVVLDEAHHLEHVATSAFGGELTVARWRRLARELERLQSAHADTAKGLLERIGEAFATIEDRVLNDGRSEDRTRPIVLDDERDLLGPLADATEKLSQAVAAEAENDLRRDRAEQAKLARLAEQAERLSEWLHAVATPEDPPTHARYAEMAGNGRWQRLVLHCKPIDVSEYLRDALFATKRPNGQVVPVISTSATLATDGGFEFWRSHVGCDEALELIVPSPFNYKRNALLYLPRDGRAFDPRTAQGDSLEYLDRLTEEIEQLLLASDGRAFVLFTSFRTMYLVHDQLAPRLHWLVLRQGELPNRELLQRFRENGRAVLFATRSFWEGVDIVGEALSLVIIDKLPFPTPDDPLWQARCEAINREYGDRWAWFTRLAIPTVTLSLKQGFGRLIRSSTDRGVVAILDGRLSTLGYGRRIVQSLPPATVTRSLDAVRLFFEVSDWVKAS